MILPWVQWEVQHHHFGDTDLCDCLCAEALAKPECGCQSSDEWVLDEPCI